MSEFADDKGVVIHRKRGAVFFAIPNVLTLRFKKLDRRGRPANIPTPQQIHLYSYQYPLQLDMPQARNLTLGYRVNQAGTGIDLLSLLDHYDGQITELTHWVYAEEDIPIIKLMTQVSAPSEEAAELLTKVRLKNDTSGTTEKDENDHLTESRNAGAGA